MEFKVSKKEMKRYIEVSKVLVNYTKTEHKSLSFVIVDNSLYGVVIGGRLPVNQTIIFSFDCELETDYEDYQILLSFEEVSKYLNFAGEYIEFNVDTDEKSVSLHSIRENTTPINLKLPMLFPIHKEDLVLRVRDVFNNLENQELSEIDVSLFRDKMTFLSEVASKESSEYNLLANVIEENHISTQQENFGAKVEFSMPYTCSLTFDVNKTLMNILKGIDSIKTIKIVDTVFFKVEDIVYSIENLPSVLNTTEFFIPDEENYLEVDAKEIYNAAVYTNTYLSPKENNIYVDFNNYILTLKNRHTGSMQSTGLANMLVDYEVFGSVDDISFTVFNSSIINVLKAYTKFADKIQVSFKMINNTSIMFIKYEDKISMIAIDLVE